MDKGIVEKFELAIESIINQSSEIMVSLETTESDWEKIDIRMDRAQGVLQLVSSSINKDDNTAISHSEMREMATVYVNALNNIRDRKESWKKMMFRDLVSRRIDEI
jgi:hypothetical protein